MPGDGFIWQDEEFPARALAAALDQRLPELLDTIAHEVLHYYLVDDGEGGEATPEIFRQGLTASIPPGKLAIRLLHPLSDEGIDKTFSLVTLLREDIRDDVGGISEVVSFGRGCAEYERERPEEYRSWIRELRRIADAVEEILCGALTPEGFPAARIDEVLAEEATSS